jgi:hypothetical protein
MRQKSVFISYRRSTSSYIARSIYVDLKAHGWDCFLDVNTIDSGDFDRIILNQIGARTYFILIISPDSLLRCTESGDWLLCEIQEAVRLERNIVPIITEGVNFDSEMSYLPDDLRLVIKKKSSVNLYHSYFEEGLERLRTRFLKLPEYVSLIEPPPAERIEVARRMESVDTPFRSIGEIVEEHMILPSLGTYLISTPANPSPQSTKEDEEDNMYQQAVELVSRLDKASVSLLQRRLRIGYTRAAQLIDMMEARGVIGPSEGGSSRPRKVLLNKDK